VALGVALHAWRHYAVTLRQARLEGPDAKQVAGDAGWALRDSGDESEEEEGGGEGEEDAEGEEEDDDEDDGAVRITPAAQRRLSARVAALSSVSSPTQPSALAPLPLHPPASPAALLSP